MADNTDLVKDTRKLTKSELVDVADDMGIHTAGATKDELVEAVEDRAHDGPGYRGIRADEPQYIYPDRK